ncbi:MAG: hypothetical protein NTZ65_05110 [Candidatus Berkelbacteria bacterium]|nr:hypothetical protein [Candidatus Berkelbacteria bacterium]
MQITPAPGGETGGASTEADGTIIPINTGPKEPVASETPVQPEAPVVEQAVVQQEFLPPAPEAATILNQVPDQLLAGAPGPQQPAQPVSSPEDLQADAAVHIGADDRVGLEDHVFAGMDQGNIKDTAAADATENVEATTPPTGAPEITAAGVTPTVEAPLPTAQNPNPIAEAATPLPLAPEPAPAVFPTPAPILETSQPATSDQQPVPPPAMSLLQTPPEPEKPLPVEQDPELIQNAIDKIQQEIDTLKERSGSLMKQIESVGQELFALTKKDAQSDPSVILEKRRQRSQLVADLTNANDSTTDCFYDLIQLRFMLHDLRKAEPEELQQRREAA